MKKKYKKINKKNQIRKMNKINKKINNRLNKNRIILKTNQLRINLINNLIAGNRQMIINKKKNKKIYDPIEFNYF